MGKRDIRSREPKKTKKSAKKISQVDILTTPPPVEVVRKPRKQREDEGVEE